jgi:hypothetical protein
MNYELFENITYNNIHKLYNIIKSNSSHLEIVKIQYLRNNSYFQETLNFLISINLIEIKKNSLLILDFSNEEISKIFLKKIFQSPEYGILLKSYLNNFKKNENEEYFFKPFISYNNLTRHLRNFLISLKKIDFINGHYKIIDNTILNLLEKKEFSPEQLQKILEKQNLLGLEAEKLVVKYEAEKIKNFNQDLNIDHVALRDVSAGYDIKSYELDGESVKEIYIEVKAVSISNYKFHLSMQENQTANKFLDRYYLYLLPVDLSNSEKFDYKKLLKIQNINKTIFQNKKEWIIEEDGYVVSRKI